MSFIGIDINSNIYITDNNYNVYKNGILYKLNNSRKTTMNLKSFLSPSVLPSTSNTLVDKYANIYTIQYNVDTKNKIFYAYKNSGKDTRKHYSNNYSNKTSSFLICLDNDRKLVIFEYISKSSYKIYYMTESSNKIISINNSIQISLTNPQFFFADSSNNFYISDNNSIYKFNVDNNYSKIININNLNSSNYFNNISMITVNPNGNIFVLGNTSTDKSYYIYMINLNIIQKMNYTLPNETSDTILNPIIDKNNLLLPKNMSFVANNNTIYILYYKNNSNNIMIYQIPIPNAPTLTSTPTVNR